MKVKKSEIQLLIAVIGVLIAVCTYFFVYTKFNERSDTLESQNASLRSQVATLEILDQRKADYIAATEEMKNYIAGFENRYTSNILPEDTIMMVKQMEVNTKAVISSVAFGEDTEVPYVAANENTATDTTTTDATSSVVDTTEYANTQMYEVPVSISLECTYNDFKSLVRYIYNLQERKSIRAVSIGYNAETGTLSGNMNMSSYYLQGTDKTYTEPVIPNVNTGVDTIFGNMD